MLFFILISNPYCLCVQYACPLHVYILYICLMKAWKQCQHIAAEKQMLRFIVPE